jgi:hypothetical protein
MARGRPKSKKPRKKATRGPYRNKRQQATALASAAAKYINFRKRKGKRKPGLRGLAKEAEVAHTTLAGVVKEFKSKHRISKEEIEKQLLSRVHGNRVLTDAEERTFTDKLKNRPVGKGLDKDDAQAILDEMLKKKGLARPATTKLQRDVIQRAKKREKEQGVKNKLTYKKSTSVHPNRAMSVTAKNINTHFVNLKAIYQRLEISDPANLIVLDEVNLTPKDQVQKVYGIAGQRQYTPDVLSKGHITVLCISRGNGRSLPSMIIWEGTAYKLI